MLFENEGYDYELVVPGDPRPQGRPRARISTTRGGKKFVHIYEDAKSRNAKQIIKQAAFNSKPASIFRCPLQVDIAFYLERPPTQFGSGKNSHIIKNSAPQHHTKTPDIDNLRKLVMDALTGVIYKDDSQVVKCYTSKEYSNNPRTEIFIKTLV